MERPRLPAYISHFQLGVKLALDTKAILVMIITYSLILTVFYSIYTILPIKELHRPDLNFANLFWYFAAAQTVVVGAQHIQLRALGRQITEGRLQSLIQKPVGMMGLLFAQSMGTCTIRMAILLTIAFMALPSLANAPIPISFPYFLWLLFSILLGGCAIFLIGYTIGTFETFGPYSMPASWLAGKLIFTGGGLFFPVIFFPPLIQKIAFLTPFPSTIFIPGHFMLNITPKEVLWGFIQQFFWIYILFLLAKFWERKMFRHVLAQGD